jgi:hypothetical protein
MQSHEIFLGNTDFLTLRFLWQVTVVQFARITMRYNSYSEHIKLGPCSNENLLLKYNPGINERQIPFNRPSNALP